MRNPYQWHRDDPEHVLARAQFIDDIVSLLRAGSAVKLIGGRGMGKSVALRLVAASFEQEPETRVVRVPGPPEEPTVTACVSDLARRLDLPAPPGSSLDALMQTLVDAGVQRLIVLLDEVDQYVLLDGSGSLARVWLNRLETLRRSWSDRFTVMVAGGLGLLHVAHVLGSGLLSRAEERIMRPLTNEELAELAAPLAARGVSVEPVAFEVLRNLSGANPALATYGLARVWDAGLASTELLERVYGEFPEAHHDFVRAVRESVSRRGMVGAPGRVLTLLHTRSGEIEQRVLRDACAGDDPPVDVSQALRVLMAAGLVAVDGPASGDPVRASLVSSVLNLPTVLPEGADAVERLVALVAAVLGQMHRFGRDFHDEEGLLQEQVFNSMLAVSLALVGWKKLEPVREPVQAAGYPDLVVSPHGAPWHVVVEAKIWGRNDYKQIQQQVDDYRTSDTARGVAVMFGDRKVKGWVEAYEEGCLPVGAYTVLPTPPDVVRHWRVERPGADGEAQRTDHFLVQIPKRV